VAQNIERLSPGRTYAKVQQLQQRLQQLDQPPDPKLIQKISQGIQQKHGNSVDVAALLQAKRAERRHDCRVELQKWQQALESDPEYQNHQRVWQLWHDCQGHVVWNNYQRLDLKISQSRNARGSTFEKHYSDLVFCIMAIELSKTTTMQPWEYSYYQNLYWFGNGMQVGEIDIVVYDDMNKVAAICEMKTSCYELHTGKQQHEGKLTAAVAWANDKDWKIGKNPNDGVNVMGVSVPLFLATLTPSSDQSSHETEYTGAEPALVHAICRGIRQQGKCIMHPSNVALCHPLIELLQNKSYSSEADESAMKYLERVPSMPDSPHADDDLDHKLLQKYVMQVMGWKNRTFEHPLQYLKTFPSNRMLLLPRDFRSLGVERA
jgi:hypothetical protein